MDAMAVVIRFVHILAAVVAGGAAIFQWWAVRPAMAVLDEPARAELRERIARRWFGIVVFLAVALLATGLMNFLMFKVPEYRGHSQKAVYHAVFGVKLLVALVVLHQATVLSAPGPRGEKRRAQPGRWNLLVAGVVIVIALGAVLSNFGRLFSA
ncbi:MAG: hypothetical protein HRU75_10220 [Planctomycetia bacterium]|nr:MAG: hypothetical protein HRU75_10220 [Planctomycetia bacterium]